MKLTNDCYMYIYIKVNQQNKKKLDPAKFYDSTIMWRNCSFSSYSLSKDIYAAHVDDSE